MPEPLNKEPSNAKIAAKNSASVYKPLTPEIIRLMKIEELLSIDSKLLNPEFELKKMFGSKVINQELTGGRFPNNKYRKNKLYRRGKLVFRKERPIPVTGITMKLIDTDEESGQKIFKFNHSSTYRDIQKQFLVAVDSYNPDFIVNLLRNYPYHIDAHIQLSDMAKHSEDMQIASQLIEDAINFLQNTFDFNFDICSSKCLLPYKYQENRSLHILLFKYLMFLGQRGCSTTALQHCKKLASLDSSDPLAVTLMIDFYALKSGQFKWLCELYECWNDERNLNQLPNWAYSAALAYYLNGKECIQHESTSKLQKNSSKAKTKDCGLTKADHFLPSDNNSLEEKGNVLLQYAILMFPSVLLPLLEKCGIQSDSKLMNHWYFNSNVSKKQSKSLNLLCELYVWRTYHVWKDPSIIQWLESNTQIALNLIDNNKKVTEDYSQKRQRRYTGIPYNILRHVILLDSKDITIPLPPELVNKPILGFDPVTPGDGIDIYNYQQQQLSRPSASGGNDGVLAMLFRSLVFDLNAIQGGPIEHQNQAGGNELGRIARVADEVQADQEQNQAAGGGGAIAGIQDSVNSLLHAMRDLLQTVNPTRDDGNDEASSGSGIEDNN